MPEVLNYVPAKEGLAALDAFVAGKSRYSDLLPFALPVKYQRNRTPNAYAFTYYLGSQTGIKRNFCVYLSKDQTTRLGDTIFVVPHKETTRGTNPYYWLNFHVTPEPNSQSITSCCLQPENESHKFNFKKWHSLEEQLLVDYLLGHNNLNFNDILPFSFLVTSKKQSYELADNPNWGIRISAENIQKGDTLRVIPRTDDQRFYEWVDILKVSEELPEEKWPLVSSYRISSAEHRIYSIGWFGPERQLLIDRMLGRNGIGFDNLKPIIAFAVVEGRLVYFFESRFVGLNASFSVPPGRLTTGEKTISIPRIDDQGIYEWLELYRLDPSTNERIDGVITSARITSEGLAQKDWLGEERQLLKDYTDGVVSFGQLKPLHLKSIKNETTRRIHLWGYKKQVSLTLSRRLKLKPDDEVTLVPERETEEGTDFLLTKDGATLARYRLDLKTKKFTCIDSLVAKEQTASTDGWVEILKEYERRLLAGEKLSYEEFMKRRQI